MRRVGAFRSAVRSAVLLLAGTGSTVLNGPPAVTLPALLAGGSASLVVPFTPEAASGQAAERRQTLAPAPRATYADATARRLHQAALDERERVDSTVLAYTAVVRQRIGAALRMPLKDRTLYRSEASHRLWWSRDGENLVQVLAYREQSPVGVDEDDIDLGRFDTAFDPTADRLFFGFASRDDDVGDPDEDEFWFEHPLERRYVDAYRFTTGDTVTLSLPDGRTVRAVELQVVPHQADVHRMTGALWIEPESGALVRAVYRLSDTFDAFRDIPDLQEEDDDLSFIPGMLKPWTVDVSMISVDYGLWDFSVWMPRSMRMEGVVAAGILKAPITFDYAYELESVETTVSRAVEDAEGPDDDLPTVHFATRSEAMAYLNELAFGEDVAWTTGTSRSSGEGEVRYMVPEDRSFLRNSDALPPPVWEEAPGFASEEELRQRFDVLADLPQAPLRRTPTTFRWGFQRPDLIRYNRVEGLSVGARAQARPATFLGPLSLTLTGRIGYGDRVPNAHLDVSRETLRRRISVQGYHELVSIEPRARHLGLGNSAMALLFGRDDGDYYRRSGAALEWTPPSAERRSHAVRLYAELHRPVDAEVDFAVRDLWDDDWAFRPNLVARRGWEYGAAVELSPWWGTDPRLAQGGLDLSLRAATGEADFATGSLLGRLVLPVTEELRLALEAGGGLSAGAPTPQRLWYVGGVRTLRGYAPRTLGGERMVRGRGELARRMPFGRLSVFGDYAWAGDGGFSLDDGFYSAGLGLSLVDGLIRLDAGYGLKTPRGWRVDFYLDSVL